MLLIFLNSECVMRIVFAGSPDFALPALQALLASPHELVAVYSQPDRPSGRGRRLTPTAVKTKALASGCEVLTPVSLRDEKAAQVLSSFQPDVMVVVAYGLILPASILSIPRWGCVNIHPSLLPRWRGAAPIQSAIAAGDKETAVAIMKMDVGMDTGPIYRQVSIPISDNMTSGSCHAVCAEEGAKLLLTVLSDIEAGVATLTPQSEAGVTYSHKITKAQAQLNWQQSASQLHDQVRAYNPFPVAYTHLGDVRYRVWSTEMTSVETTAQPGTVVGISSQGIEVATGQGVLRIVEWQAPGKRRIAISDWWVANQDSLVVGESCLKTLDTI